MPNKKNDIFGRLTDPSLYTGTHVHRFDETGHGRGLQGRDRVPKGQGTADAPYLGGPIIDIAEVMRPNLREKNHAYVRPFSAKVKRKPCKERRCNNHRNPVSKLGLCSYHQWIRHEESAYPKYERSEDEIAASLVGLASAKGKRQLNNLCSIRDCGNDRLPSNEKKLCGYHAKRLKAHTEAREAEANQLKGAMDDGSDNTKFCSIHECKGYRYRMGYCAGHFQEMVDRDAKSHGVSADAASPKRKHKSSSDIFSRLTDPEMYTGLHQHRFDKKTGKGLGLKGRDFIAKGGGHGKYHGGPINDLSQICRPNLR